MESSTKSNEDIWARLKVLEDKVQKIMDNIEISDTIDKNEKPWEVVEIGKVMTKWYNSTHEGVIVSASREKNSGWVNTSTFRMLTELPIEKVMFLLSPFASEQRIKILFQLFEHPKSATDLNNTTGLQGGQLYHHLEMLVEAKYIEKVYKGQYRLTSIGRWAFLNTLHTAHHLGHFNQNK